MKKTHKDQEGLQHFLEENGTAVLPEASVFGDMVKDIKISHMLSQAWDCDFHIKATVFFHSSSGFAENMFRWFTELLQSS